jgi:hypothetical protein
VVGPSNLEKAIGEAGFLVGNGVVEHPVHRVKLRQLPVVDPAKVIHLGLVLLELTLSQL